MAILYVAAALVAGAAAGIAGTNAAKHFLRRTRDDHERRPALWDRFYSIDWGDTTTNNYGFAPASGHHPQRFQHQMYRELTRRLTAVRAIPPGLKLLEVSCGRGGGLNAIVADNPQIDATGLDVAQSAIDFCKRNYAESGKLRFVQGSALDLPFPDDSFDVILNVEASNDYGDRARFFTEVARVLKSGGVFLYTDSFRRAHVEEMHEELREAGFEAEFVDITSNVADACRQDSPRRRQVIARHAPLAARLFFKRQLNNYAAIEGSDKYDSFASGRRAYLMTAACME